MTTSDRPILFSGPLVRAILDGRKTQTRRPVKLSEHADVVHPWRDGRWEFGRCFGDGGSGEATEVLRCPFGVPGDRLWVREPTECRGCLPIARQMEVRYRADGTTAVVPWPERIKRPAVGKGLANGAYKEAARIWLEVTGVRVERVQAISAADSRAEGMKTPLKSESAYVRAFEHAWRGIYDAPVNVAPKDEPRDMRPNPARWAANPWVWVVEFEVLSTTGRPA